MSYGTYSGHDTDFYETTDAVAETVNLAIKLQRPILVEGEPVRPLKLKPKLLSPSIRKFGAAKLAAMARRARVECMHLFATHFFHLWSFPERRNSPNFTVGL